MQPTMLRRFLQHLMQPFDPTLPSIVFTAILSFVTVAVALSEGAYRFTLAFLVFLPLSLLFGRLASLYSRRIVAHLHYEDEVDRILDPERGRIRERLLSGDYDKEALDLFVARKELAMQCSRRYLDEQGRRWPLARFPRPDLRNLIAFHGILVPPAPARPEAARTPILRQAI